MELKRALLSRRGIFRTMKDLGTKRVLKNKLKGALEVAKRDGAVYEQAKEKGVIRIRMMVKKCDLEKIMYAAGGAGNDVVLVQSLVEQRLRQLRRKHHSYAKVVDRKGAYWAPALRSIPEEF